MYKFLARYLTNYYANRNLIDNSSIEVYKYGFEILISTITYYIIFFLVSAVTDTLCSSSFYLIGFFIIRTISGGYHAKTYLRCHIAFEITHITFLVFIKSISFNLIPVFFIVFMIIAGIILVLFSPIDHENKPFTNNEKKRFRKLSLLYSMLVIFIGLVFVVLPTHYINVNSLSFAVGTIVAAISLVIAKIKQEVSKHEKDKETYL